MLLSWNVYKPADLGWSMDTFRCSETNQLTLAGLHTMFVMEMKCLRTSCSWLVNGHFLVTRISGPYGPLKIPAPVEGVLASPKKMFISLTSFSSPPSTFIITNPNSNIFCPPASVTVKNCLYPFGQKVPLLRSKNVWILFPNFLRAQE